MAGAAFTRSDFVRWAAASGAGLLAGPRLVEKAFAAIPAAPLKHHFYSRPDLRPPVLNILRRRPGRAEGDLFLAPLSGPGQRGNYIVDDAGDPIWFRPATPVVSLNFRAAIYRGKPVLTWWEGKTEAGLGDGTHYVLDDSYRQIAKLPAGAGRHSDLHEFLITPRGTALVSAWESVPTDLSGIGGLANGVVVEAIVQELALPSGKVLFEWRSLDHVGIDESHAGVSTKAPYDYFHINSVELDRDGNYIVSARNTWTIYKIHHGTGEVMWRLGGKKSDFTMGPGTNFAWQHDARRLEGNLLSLYDDGAAPQVEAYSRALIFAVDEKNKRATLHRKYVHNPPLSAHALGSTQILPNGNVLVGWGTEPNITEYTPGGKVVFEAKLPKGGQNYRALRFPWHGHPKDRPAIHPGAGFAYATWNGATEVASWQLDTGKDPNALQTEVTVPRKGFETRIAVKGLPYARVTALDASGQPLGTSKRVRFD